MSARILIVDDNPTNRKLVCSLLELEGHTVIQAVDAIEAQVRLRESVPDLILMDIALPGMDGLALTRHIKADVRLRHVPVVALTAFAMKGDEEKARAAGCAGYITKPIDTRKLPNQVQSFLKFRRDALRILIADDNPTNLRLLRAQLEAEGHVVHAATTGVEALELLEHEPIDGVVSDILMPVMDGYRLCLSVRRHPRFGNVPFVLYTATYNSPADRDLAETAGADAYITKPSPTEDIIAALRRASSRPRHALPAADLENPVLKQYSEVLIRKLEERNEALGQAYDGLAYTEARLSGILESAQDAIITTDARQNVILFNPAAEQMFRCNRTMALGKPLSQFIPARFRDSHARLVDEFGETIGQRRQMSARQVWALRADGSEFPIEATIAKQEGSRGRTYSVFMRDVSERHAAQEALRAAEMKYRSIFENLVEGVLQTTLEGRPISGNPAAARLLGYAKAEDAIADIKDIATELYVDPDARRQMVEDLLAGKTVHGREARIRRKDGQFLWVSISASLDTHPQTGERTVLTVVQDINERKQQVEKIARLSRVSAVLSGINGLIVRATDQQTLFQDACDLAVTVGGFRGVWLGIADAAAGLLRRVAHAGVAVENLPLPELPLDPGTEVGLAARAIRTGVAQIADDPVNDSRIHFRGRLANAGVRSMGVFPLVVENQAIGVISLLSDEVGVFDDTEIKLLNELADDIAFAINHLGKVERLQYLAQYNTLTELPNRALFLERLTHVLQGDEHESDLLAVVLLDLERFRHINDSFGRATGDSLLRQVAASLRREAESSAHIGGDVFALTVSGVGSISELTHRLDDITQRCFGAPFRAGNEPLHITCSVGVAVYPGDGSDAEGLLGKAEAALRRSKDTREHRVFYSADINARASEAVALETRLRRAIEREEFILHYQPKVTFPDRRICGLEALIRWQDPERGLVAPGLFIPILEDAGLIERVGEWALQQALADQRAWREAGLAPPGVAVNVSPRQMRRRDFAESVKRLAAASPGAELELEITESLIMDDVERAIATLKEIRAAGVTVAIDDFGTGYCSLSYVARLPVTALKIDRSFVIGMTGSREGLAIASSIIALAHSLRLKVVAEGIETEEQARLLHLLACDEGQGYLFSKPLPFAQIEQLLRSNTLPAAQPAPG